MKDVDSLEARIRELEIRLEESESTLDAIRRGDIDAVVVSGAEDEHRVFTLESADRPYRVLIEQMQEGALTLAEDGTVLYCNRRFSDMVGFPQERVIGQPLAPYVLARDSNTFVNLTLAARCKVVRTELVLLTATGTQVPVQLSLGPLSNEGDTTLLCGVVTDTTDQKRHLEELASANERLKTEMSERERVEDALRQSQKMEAVGQLTGGVAHDFNNLLTVIKSSTDLLKRPNITEERRTRYIGAISETVDRAAKLTGQLLAFARRQTLNPETFAVTSSVRGLADMMGTLAGSRVRITTEFPDQLCYVNADASQFDTALVNLAVNARDAMNGEGRITISVREVDRMPTIRAHSPVAGMFVAVSLSDTGVGIPAESVDRIFEPFFTTKGVGKGTGLGLSQVFGFVKQSGGDVAVSSVVGEGTTFTIYLPSVTAPAQPTAVEPSEARVDGQGTRVLVVEDNVDVGTFAVQTLSDLGYTTVLAADGTAALTELAIGADRFDIVFSDVMMPGMSGIELGLEIRRLYQGLPVVLTSGYSHVLAQDGTHGFEVLNKPYSVEQLSQVLQKAVIGQRHKPNGRNAPAE